MTVAELIAELQKLPQDLPVMLGDTKYSDEVAARGSPVEISEDSGSTDGWPIFGSFVWIISKDS